MSSVLCEAAAAVSRIEVCKTSKLSEGKFIKAFCHPFCAFTKRMEKFPIGNAIGGFAAIIAAKRRILLRQQQEESRQGRRKSTRSVPSRQGQTFRRKVTKAARPPKKRPQGGKGFNWVSAKSLLGCADSRFGKPRSSLGERF